MFKTLVLIFLLLPSISSAEYRVYQYYVKSKYKTPYDSGAYLVTSTLDPVSYVAYHGGNDSILVDMLKTWTCKGNTSGEDICPSPYKIEQKSQKAL